MTLTCEASEPLTVENRRAVLDWVLGWGGHGALTPEGTDSPLLVLYSDMGERVVRAGQRVIYDGVNFHPAEIHFEDKWSPSAGGAEPGDAPVLDQTPS